jgi:hypothetical protein
MGYLRRLPPGVMWLFLSAAILVINAICLQAGGHRALANWGFFGGSVAIAIAVAFGDWSRPKAPRSR